MTYYEWNHHKSCMLVACPTLRNSNKTCSFKPCLIVELAKARWSLSDNSEDKQSQPDSWHPDMMQITSCFTHWPLQLVLGYFSLQVFCRAKYHGPGFWWCHRCQKTLIGLTGMQDINHCGSFCWNAQTSHRKVSRGFNHPIQFLCHHLHLKIFTTQTRQKTGPACEACGRRAGKLEMQILQGLFWHENWAIAKCSCFGWINSNASWLLLLLSLSVSVSLSLLLLLFLSLLLHFFGLDFGLIPYQPWKLPCLAHFQSLPRCLWGSQTHLRQRRDVTQVMKSIKLLVWQAQNMYGPIYVNLKHITYL